MVTGQIERLQSMRQVIDWMPLTNLANFARIVGSTCYSAMAPKLTHLMKDGIIFIIQLKFPSAMKSKEKLRIASRMERVMEILRDLYEAW